MLLHGYHANGGCGLPGDAEGSGKKCGMIAEGIAGKGTLSEGADWGKGKMVILRMLKHGENGGNRTVSMRRRCGRWIHLNRSYGWKVVKGWSSGTFLQKDHHKQVPEWIRQRRKIRNTLFEQENAFWAETERKYAFSKRKRTQGKLRFLYAKTYWSVLRLHLNMWQRRGRGLSS